MNSALRVRDGILVYLGGLIFRSLGHKPEATLGIRGDMRIEARERGKLVTTREGHNVCTLSGREFLLERAVLSAVAPSRVQTRSDCLRYIGMGSGAQPEVSGVTSLVQPIPYVAGEFLAPLNLPVWTLDSGGSGTRTAVQLVREFSAGELSLGATVLVSEAGLYSDGDPNNDMEVGDTPTDLATAGGRAPFFYRSFDPITKNTDRTIRIVWTIRHL